jgi:4-amino-4-deoxy-L-arabinose transferase-like glycosyltransferase
VQSVLLSQSTVAAAGLLLIIVASAALLLPLLAYPFGRDQGVFATAADILAAGGVPYRDIWDVKPPGVFYWYWASFVSFGRTMAAPRLLDVIWMAATAGLLFALGRRLLSPWVGAAGALFLVIRYVAGNSFWNTTQPDGLAMLPLIAAASALVGAEEHRSRARAFACGALVALAILFKFTLGIFLVLPIIALAASSEEPRRTRAQRLLAYLGGCAAVLAVVVLLLWQAGALRDTFEVLFAWNARYSQLDVPVPLATNPSYQTWRFLLGLPHTLLFPIGLLAMAGTADLVFRRGSGPFRWLLPVWALLLMLSVWVQGKFYTYHWLPMLPPLALLAGQGLRTIARAVGDASSPRTGRAVAAAMALVVALLLGIQYWRTLAWPIRHLAGRVSQVELLARYNHYGDFSLAADREAAAYVGDRTGAGETIFIWGFEPLVYFLADRQPASRFIYTVPLVTKWSPPEWQNELIRDLAEQPPSYILILHNDRLPWMTGRSDDSAAQLLSFPALTRVLDERYEKESTIEDFTVWRLRQRVQSDR